MAGFKQVLDSGSSKMSKAVETLKGEFSRLRTGRASTALLDGVRVEYYGASMSLSQVATLSVPESRTIVITPWDKGLISEVEKAIHKSDLGVTPSSDGNVIRVNIPAPTEERRKELVKQARKLAEEARVAVRNGRREANEALKALQKSGGVSEDENRKGETEIQKVTDQFVSQVDQLLAHKEKEIMEV